MAKLIQICASQNDLFALDDQGDVHQYNFKVKTWVKLIVDRSSEEEMPGGGRECRQWRRDAVWEPTHPSYPSDSSFLT